MMRRPYNFLEESGQRLKEVEDREEELELVQDYDMFSAYPFLTERTPQEKVIEAPIFQDPDVLFSPQQKRPRQKKKGGGPKRSSAQKTSSNSFPWNVQVEGTSVPCAGVGTLTI